MAKLRNSDTDVGAFVQWIGRKIRNHNPLGELKRAPKGPSRTVVFVVAGHGDVLYARTHDRFFEVTTREITAEEMPDADLLVAVGH